LLLKVGDESGEDEEQQAQKTVGAKDLHVSVAGSLGRLENDAHAAMVQSPPSLACLVRLLEETSQLGDGDVANEDSSTRRWLSADGLGYVAYCEVDGPRVLVAAEARELRFVCRNDEGCDGRALRQARM
jgi:hypothetical protein